MSFPFEAVGDLQVCQFRSESPQRLCREFKQSRVSLTSGLLVPHCVPSVSKTEQRIYTLENKYSGDAENLEGGPRRRRETSLSPTPRSASSIWRSLGNASSRKSFSMELSEAVEVSSRWRLRFSECTCASRLLHRQAFVVSQSISLSRESG